MTAPAVRFDCLDVAPEEEARLAALLDAGERERAARLRFERDRRRFVVRRGRAREWLAEAVGGDPARLRIDVTAHGKPYLPGGPHFSLSHSGETMMLAIGEVELGCDVEKIDPALDWPPLARTFFSAAENEALAALGGEAARLAFFACWSRKEAFVKALGRGLSYPLDAFTVTVDDRPRILSGGDGWAVADIQAPPGYRAALVFAAS
ncbi:MAG: 4'-phosphopantetheinyl transferase family protein [Sphingomonas sp.]